MAESDLKTRHVADPTLAAKSANGDAVQRIRDRDVLGKMLDAADVLYGMLAARQQASVSPEQRLAFALDEKNVRLAGSIMESFDKILKYGVPRLATIDYVGDVPQGPTRVENRMTFVLNVGNDPGRPVRTNGDDQQRPSGPAPTGPVRFELDMGAPEGGNGSDHNNDC